MAHGSLHQFKAALERRQARKDKNDGKFDRSKTDFSSSNVKTIFDFPKLSELEMETLKEKIRADIRAEKRKDFLIVLSLTGLVIVILIVLS